MSALTWLRFFLGLSQLCPYNCMLFLSVAVFVLEKSCIVEPMGLELALDSA